MFSHALSTNISDHTVRNEGTGRGRSTILYDLRCNAGGCYLRTSMSRLYWLGMSKARGRGRSTTLNCTCA